MVNTSYFYIKKELLGTKKIFPFQIFIFDPKDNSHSSFLKANSPFTKSQSTQLSNCLVRGCSIAILDTQKITFHLFNSRVQASSNQNNSNPKNNKLTKKNNLDTTKSEQSIQMKTPFKSDFTREEFEVALQDNNYSLLIQKAAKELNEFSLTDCQTTSLAVHLSDMFLNTDTKLNRVVTVAYFFAKVLNMNDKTTLASLVCAGFLSRIGMINMPLRLSRMDESEYTAEEKSAYEKYPYLSLHLCQKADIHVTTELQDMLLDHQEKLSGNGFPSAKSGAQLSRPSLVIAFVSFIIEQNDKELPLREFINQNHNFLVLEFGDKIVNTFSEMLRTSTFKKSA
ncbi:MAG: hypothetical protein HN576_16030 [Bacteriovoracaceae bacterium]|jgi:HD-GYP domain-containing protein (c-di-GMP phosphodiesterase class II)|nr:hypothetical protein [Bacteriovoracaceae bacterium]